jgi:DNA-binding NtrC family response regulator
VKEGKFKDDLLQRIQVLPIQLPPLRERKDDIPLLIDHFVKKQRKIEFSKETIEVLRQYSWPGNVRELANIVAYVATMSEGTEVSVSDLPSKLIAKTASRSTFYDQVAEFEKELLEREFEAHAGNISKLSTSLKMDRSHLYSKLKEYGIYTPKP